MKKITFYYLFILAVMLNLSSCGDKDTAEPSRLELLTSKTWQTNKIIASGINLTLDPFYADFLPKTYKFNTDKTFTITYSPGPLSGTWEFASDETIIVTDPGTDDEQRYTIIELKENYLKATVNDPTYNVPLEVELVPVP